MGCYHFFLQCVATNIHRHVDNVDTRGTLAQHGKMKTLNPCHLSHFGVEYLHIKTPFFWQGFSTRPRKAFCFARKATAMRCRFLLCLIFLPVLLAACGDSPATATPQAPVSALTPDAFMQEAVSTAQTSNTQQAGTIVALVAIASAAPPTAKPVSTSSSFFAPTTAPAATSVPVPTATPARTAVPSGPFTAKGSRVENQISNDTPKAGNIFMVVGFQLVNITDKEFGATTYDFKLRASDGFDYNASSATYLLSRGVSARTLLPKQDVSGEMAFEIPENAKAVSITFDDGTHNYTAPVK
jgi:hypothetical protein